MKLPKFRRINFTSQQQVHLSKTGRKQDAP